MQAIKDTLQKKESLKLSFIYTFLWGILAHGYVFLSKAFSHDSLYEYIATPAIQDWKMQLGRVFIPLYEKIFRGYITLPWLIGIISLVCIAASVFLVTEIFEIDNKAITFLTSGIFTANVTVIAIAATYIHDMDCDMIALLFAVVAVYLWNNVKNGFILAVPFLAVMFGFYQCSVSVTITLVILISVINLLKNKDARTVFVNGVKAVFMIILSGLIYIVLMKIMLKIFGSTLLTGNYNSLDNMLSLTPGNIIKLICETFSFTLSAMFNPTSAYPDIIGKLLHILIIATTIITTIVSVFTNKIKAVNRVFAVFLFALMPIGMNVSRILASGYSHELMHYSVRLIYFIMLMLSCIAVKQGEGNFKKFFKAHNYALMILIMLVMWGNVRLANVTYIAKDHQHDANLSLYTRILSKIESVDGYIPGETEVAIVGSPAKLLEEVEPYNFSRKMTGMSSIDVMGTAPYLGIQQHYFEYILMSKINLVKMDRNEQIEKMSSFPASDCVQIIDNVIVIKLS